MSHAPSPNYYNQSSKRLIFRSFEDQDDQNWEPFFINNPMLRYVGGDLYAHLSSLEKATNWIDMQRTRQKEKLFGQLAVIDKDSGEFIGLGGVIYRQINNVDEYEITYSLLQKAHGKGLGTELAVHFKEYLKNELDLDSVISIIHVDNEPSINVAKKNGMVFESKFEFLGMPVALFRTKL